MSVYSQALELVRTERLFEGVGTIVIGLSGGPDSVCLLDVIALMVERGELEAALHPAHLNHGLRGAESDGDEAFVRRLAARRGLPLTVSHRDVEAVRAETGESLEEAARRERYDFLAGVAEDQGAEAVAVGHHADDQVETVVHRLLRGAGLRGLGGMPRSRPIDEGSAVRLVRPLLTVRRHQVLEYLAERGLSFRSDASNVDRQFLRNRIRHELVPTLERDYNPGFSEAILRLSDAAARAHDYLTVAADAACCVSGSEIELDRFRELHPALKPLVIDRALADLGPTPQLDAVHYNAVIRAADTSEPGARLDLPGGLYADIRRDRIRFGRGAAPAQPARVEAPLPVPGRADLPERGLAVEAELADRPAFDVGAFLRAKTRYHEMVDYDRLGGPLVVRSRRDGDRFHPLGATGTKTVSDFLTDAKASPEERDAALIVADGDRPIWLIGHRIDDRVKVDEGTKRIVLLRAHAARRDGNQR